jgi:hypothetical protein
MAESTNRPKDAFLKPGIQASWHLRCWPLANKIRWLHRTAHTLLPLLRTAAATNSSDSLHTVRPDINRCQAIFLCFSTTETMK